MARPANYPDWATGASADVVEPIAGKKAVGWVSGERPPAQFINWVMEITRDWIEHLDSDPIMVPAAGAIADDTTPALWGTTEWGSSGAGITFCWFPLHGLKTGDSVSNVTLHIKETNTAGETVVIELYDVDKTDGSSTKIGATITSGITNGYVDLDYTADGAFPWVVEADHYYTLKVELKQTTNPGLCKVFGMKIDRN